MATKPRFSLELASCHDATFQNGTPVEIESTMIEHSDGQPGNFTVYKTYHDKLRRADGWYCFVVYRPHGRSGCTIVTDKMCKASNLALLRWRRSPRDRTGKNIDWIGLLAGPEDQIRSCGSIVPCSCNSPSNETSVASTAFAAARTSASIG